jgi:hypothetical protein
LRFEYEARMPFQSRGGFEDEMHRMDVLAMSRALGCLKTREDNK